MPQKSKMYLADREKRNDTPQPLDAAVEVLKGFGARKFDQSVELCVHLGIDARQADQLVRGSISLPKGIGKSKRVVAFVPDDRVESAKEAGAFEAGGEALAKRVQGGWTDFDVAVASPDMMQYVGRLGRILGPQGKMPTPKNGTVTADVESAVREYAAGRVDFRNDAGGNVHCVVGKLSFSPDDLRANIEAMIARLRKMKPAASRGQYLRRAWLSATMTPSVVLQLE